MTTGKRCQELGCTIDYHESDLGDCLHPRHSPVDNTFSVRNEAGPVDYPSQTTATASLIAVLLLILPLILQYDY